MNSSLFENYGKTWSRKPLLRPLCDAASFLYMVNVENLGCPVGQYMVSQIFGTYTTPVSWFEQCVKIPTVFHQKNTCSEVSSSSCYLVVFSEDSKQKNETASCISGRAFPVFTF